MGGVGHEDSDAEDGHHVEDRPDSDGESGHGDQGHPDREDSGEHIRPAEEADRGQTHGIHLLRACVVETGGNQMRCEHDALGVVAPVGGQHDGRQHGQVTGGQQQTRDEELKLSLEKDQTCCNHLHLVVGHGEAGVIAGRTPVTRHAGAGGVEHA